MKRDDCEEQLQRKPQEDLQSKATRYAIMKLAWERTDQTTSFVSWRMNSRHDFSYGQQYPASHIETSYLHNRALPHATLVMKKPGNEGERYRDYSCSRQKESKAEIRNCTVVC
ncbi:hypothetical protein BCV70DRAFT_119500 [Testicularia cyperi]|uniref:Uncharacterized protein n=1 Tax=Testicularia cyperi TaxID=1882483 RepID=A0A317XN35_9BASI|nr:hypothetical protein BCV70DRAFT_119500 [Testicularia cyperi]